MRTAVPILACLLAACAKVPAPSSAGQTRACNPNADAAQRGIVSRESGRLEPFIYPLIERVVTLPDYSDHWLEHHPRWTFVVAFTDPPPLSRVQALAPPQIRDRIAVRTAKRSRHDIAAARDFIVARLRSEKLGGWSSGYRPTTQCFHIEVESTAAAQRVRALLPPEILIDSHITVGSSPVLF